MADDSKQQDTKYRAPALDKGLDILELLALQPGGMTRAEIVKAIGRGPSEIYRMIERLVAREYVSRSAEGDRYSLTMKLFMLGNVHPPLRRLTAHAQPLMDELASATNQSLHLAALEGDHAIVIANASSPANWEFKLRIGAPLSLVETSSGKTLLAFQDSEDTDQLIKSSNSPQVIPKKDLINQLDSIRQAGFRISESSQLIGVTDISAPILGIDGYAIGVLTCPYIARVDQKSGKQSILSIDEICSALRNIAGKMSFAKTNKF